MRDGATIGVADHSGWAILVTVSTDGKLLERRRVRLVDADLPAMPHHHPAQRLPIEQALELVERVRGSAERHARLALDAVEAAVASPIRRIALRECPRLPDTVEERIRSYWAQNRADSVMYREALAGAAKERGWSVGWYDPKKVFGAAAKAMHIEDLDLHFGELRKSFGPPWDKDHRMAMAAAMAAATGER